MSPPSLPASVEHALAGAPRDRPVAILLRHGARESIPEGSVGYDLPITPAGRLQAEHLGTRLGPDLRALFSSPLARCTETAAALARGAEVDLPIRTSKLLGDPGAFVADDQLAWTNWQELGHEGVMRHLGRRSEALPGMVPRAQATATLRDWMLQEAGEEPGFHLFVTHDALVLPFAAELEDRVFEEEEWPGFLEGVWLVAGETKPLLAEFGVQGTHTSLRTTAATSADSI